MKDSSDLETTDQQQMHLLIYQSIRDECDKGLCACEAFLDFKKAFDTVNYDTLNKLTHEIRGQGNNWLDSYLTHRI